MFKTLIFFLTCCALDSASNDTKSIIDENAKGYSVSNLTYSATENSNEKKINYRLPNVVEPISYDLKLNTFLDETDNKNFTFDGVVRIQIMIKNETKTITLHSETLKLANVELKNDHNEKVSATWKYDPDNHFLEINCGSKNLDPNSFYTVEIKFEGQFLTDMEKGIAGFHKNYYINDEGNQIWFAATRLQPDGARRLFPCFDEPEYKASFYLQVTHHKNFSVISNTEAAFKSMSSDDQRTTTIFKSTPVMSTYNLAIFISDFLKVTDNQTNHSIYFKSTWNPSVANFTLQIEDRILKKYEEYTNISFEMNKMDLVAIPGYIDALENWGSVFFKESLLLHNNKISSSIIEKINIALLIAHEYAHQWFGNLVTCKWWKYLWLNEGISEFLSTEILNKIEPKWRSYLYYYQAKRQQIAFYADSLSNAHPVEIDVGYFQDVRASFDDRILYNKGASITHMMQHFVTESNFKKGLQTYLKKYARGVVLSSDLYDVIQVTLDENKYKLEFTIKDIMDSWITQSGFPIIQVTRNYRTQSVEIRQKHYSYSDTNKLKNQTWYVPINFATENNPNFDKTVPDIWLKEPALNISIQAKPEDWVVFNKQQTGFYRVNYDEKNWRLITKYLKSSDREKIHIMNRVQLMIDALEFHQLDSVSLHPILNLIDSLKSETEYAVKFYGFRLISWLNDQLVDTKHYLKFKNKMMNILEGLFEVVGTKETESEDFTKKIRGLIVEWLCKLENSKYTKQVQEQFIGWLTGSFKKNIPPDMKYATFYCGLKNAAQKIINATSAKLSNNSDTFEKNSIKKALLATSDENQLNSIYYLSQHEDLDVVLEKNIIGLDSFLNFLDSNLGFILKKFKPEKIDSLLHLVIKKISKYEQMKMFKIIMKRFEETKDYSFKADRFFRAKILWLNYNKESLENWFR